MEKTKKRNNKDRKDGFYEVMPGYADNPSLFSTAEEDYENQEESQVRAKMLTQLAALSGLLILQLVLFAILFQLTVNLG